MATLSELRAQQTGQGTSTSLKRGSTQRSLGGSQVVATQNAPPPKQGIVQQFVSKAGAVGGQTFSAAVALGNAAGKFVGNTAVDVARQAKGAVNIMPDIARANIKQRQIAENSRRLDAKQSEIVRAYKSGKMSKEDYSKSLKALSMVYSDLSKSSQQVARDSDPNKHASDLAWTAINIALVGGVSLVKAGVKPVVGKVVAGKVASTVVNKSIVRVEDTIMKVPAAKDLLARNASKVVSREKQRMDGETVEQWFARSGRDATIGLLIKRPLFYQQNIGFANEAYGKILDGKYQDALTPMAWLGVQMIGGGPLIAGAKFIKGKAGELSKGRGSFIDELSRKTDTNLAEYIENAGKPKGEVSTFYHGSTDNKLTSLVPGSTTGLNEKRNLIYLTDDEVTAKTYAKVRGTDGTGKGVLTDSPTGKVYKTSLEGRVIGAYDRSELDALKSAPGYEQLSTKTKNQLTNDTGLSAEILENNPELVNFLKENNITAVRAHLPNGAGKSTEIIVINPARVNIGDTQDTANVARTWKIAQHTNMTAANGRAEEAAENFLQPYIQAGVDLKTITEKELTEGMAKWAQADELRVKRLGAGLIKGIDPSDIDKYAVVRWDTVMKDGLTRELAQHAPNETLDLTARQSMLEKLIEISERPGVGWGNNELLLTRIQNIVANAPTVTDLAKGIKQIDTASVAIKGMPKKIAKEFGDLGYTIAAPFGGNRIARVDYENIDSQKIITGAMNDNPELFDAATSPQPILKAISGALNKSGLSPEGNAQLANKKLSEALIANIGELDVARPLALEGKGDAVNGGRAILSQLQNYVETKKGAFLVNKISSGKSAVTDIRQLTNDEIATALNIGKSDAKEVAKSIRDAYTKVPLEFRGLGDKIVDYAIAAPASPMRYYQRIQSALRYTYNPFFRFQEQVETAVLSQMDANKFIWPSRSLDETARKLESSGLFSGNVFGAGADDAVIGRISANLTKYQKRNLAGLAEGIAKTQGKTVDDILRDNPEQIDDALRMIVQYPKKGITSSPLARTLNIAFFPLRYNAKVSVVAAEKLATMPTSIQFATLNGLFKMKDWLKSDEGLAWQAEHADAIQVWSWATPVGSIASFYRIAAGNVSAPGEMGLLGGLPFGVITQILDGQGIINLNKPYVDPKTGDVLPDYIPETTRAKSAVALQDLLGSMFSFPGRTLGLPGKEANLRKVVDAFIDTDGKEFSKEVNIDELTELQKNMVRVLKGDTSENTLNSLYYSPAPGQFDYYTIPSMPPIRTLSQASAPGVVRRTSLPTKAEIAAAKKAARAAGGSGRDANGKKIKPLPQPIVRPT